jgi:predicted N-formylglutamate amidohydrolase
MNSPEPSLLASDEPPPVRLLRPQGTSDVVLAADHAGRRIPRLLATLGLAPSELARHIAWDIGIAPVTEALSERLDAAAVLQTYSRLVIDCNRAPGHPTSIPAISELTRVPGNKGLSEAEREARRRAIFEPYHTAIAGLLGARAAAKQRTVLVAMHSFTPVFKSVARSVEIGVLYRHETPLSRIMLELLRREGDLVVGANEPYAITGDSDYTIPVHGEGLGLDHVEIEIRQDLIADAGGQTEWAQRLARLLAAADEKLRA